MRQVVSIIVLILSAKLAIADLGYCFKFKVEFNLQGDSTLIAYYIHSDYHFKIRNITSLDAILALKNNSGELKAYKKIIALDSLNLRNAFACRKADQLKIRIGDIISTKVIECQPCCPSNKKVFDEIDYEFCSTPVIEELTDEEIVKLKNKNPHFITYYGECFERNLQNIVIVSYNKDMTANMIIEKLRNNCCANYQGYNQLMDQYNKVKEYLRSHNIIIYKTWIGN